MTPPMNQVPRDRAADAGRARAAARDPRPPPRRRRRAIRVYKPLARTVTAVLSDGTGSPLAHEHEGSGRAVWVRRSTGAERPPRPAVKPGDVPDYRVEVDYGQGAITVDDPYRFLPTLGEMDLHLVNEGRHELLWTVLGRPRPPLPRGHRRRDRDVVRGLGAGRARRTAGGRLQQLGRPRAPDAPARAVGRLGAVRARGRQPAPATST